MRAAGWGGHPHAATAAATTAAASVELFLMGRTVRRLHSLIDSAEYRSLKFRPRHKQGQQPDAYVHPHPEFGHQDRNLGIMMSGPATRRPGGADPAMGFGAR